MSAAGPVTIRAVTPADRSAIETHLVETWRTTYSAVIGSTAVEQMLADMHQADDLIDFLCCPDARMLLAIDTSARVVGTIAMGATVNMSYVTAMYVRPAYQSLGIGTTLLGQALGAASPHLPTALSVLALRSNVTAFYQRFGFEARGRSTYKVGQLACATIEMVRRADRPRT
jgi:ribosomal protein S18 acetylase RimI-like enzyme